MGQISFAGDTLNTAIYLKRLFGSQAVVDYLTVIGNDHISDEMEEYIRLEGVGTGCLRRSEVRTVGIYSVNTDANGERKFEYWRDQSAARLLFDCEEDFAKLLNYDLIYFTGISLAILPDAVREKLLTFIEKSKNSLKVAFDSNYRPNLWENKQIARDNINRAFECCDIALPSLDDQMDLLELNNEATVVEWFLLKKTRQTILKRGSSGPRLIGKINSDCSFPSFSNVIDTTAAGDGFNAGFLASYFSGGSVFASASHGHALAKIILSYKGAICPPKLIKALNN